MLKLTLDIEYQHRDRFEAILRSAEMLAEKGISVTYKVNDYDILFAQSKLLKQKFRSGEKLDKRPLIVFERIDSASLDWGNFERELIQEDNVKAWIKETTLRDISLHNSTMVNNRYHFSKLWNKSDLTMPRRPRIILEESALKKIDLILPQFQNPRFERWKSVDVPTWKNRPVEVAFAGKVFYDSPLLVRHRRAACEAILNTNCTSVIGTGKPFKESKFDKFLMKCKIFVSPYGHGEFSWKDYEAIYAGCLLIKPSCHFVQTYKYDIFKKDAYCLETEADFSDLEKIIRTVLRDPPHFEAFARNARSELIKSSDPESYVNDFTTFLNNIACGN